MKKIRLILAFICACLLISGLTGCGFVVEDETIVITEIFYSEPDEEGTVTLTIVYEIDGEEKKIKHEIPVGEKGETGKDGNGIKGITYKSNEDGSKTICTITYTDESIDPTEIELPNGASIASLTSYTDEETGGTVVTFILNDGTELNSLLIPKGEAGKDGKDGVGIKSITPDIDPVTGNTILTIVLDNEEETTTKVEIKKGKDGKSISTIIGTESDDKYYLTIYYNEGDPEFVEFSKPKPNQWYQGTTSPDDSLGKVGDYYFDTSNKNIWTKYSDDEWTPIVDFETKDERFTVTFNANGGYFEGYSSFRIKNGLNFKATNNTVPTPVKVGYKFLGWYTTENPTVVNGAFNDLTIVCSDLTLYAAWEEITN